MCAEGLEKWGAFKNKGLREALRKLVTLHADMGAVYSQRSNIPKTWLSQVRLHKSTEHLGHDVAEVKRRRANMLGSNLKSSSNVGYSKYSAKLSLVLLELRETVDRRLQGKSGGARS